MAVYFSTLDWFVVGVGLAGSGAGSGICPLGAANR
jgi:hypothetical protein